MHWRGMNAVLHFWVALFWSSVSANNVFMIKMLISSIVFRWLTIISATVLPGPSERAARIEESLGFQNKQIGCEFQHATE